MLYHYYHRIHPEQSGEMPPEENTLQFSDDWIVQTSWILPFSTLDCDVDNQKYFRLLIIFSICHDFS
jgi:hypothetical protein